MAIYYPLAVGNSWTYAMADGSSFTNRVTETDGTTFVMRTSTTETPQHVRKEGSSYLADNFEPGNFQVILRDDVAAGDGWDITYKANGIDTILSMTVLQTGVEKQVRNESYRDVVVLEGEMKMNMNGAITPLNYKVQYYYADGVGLILTTSSAGDAMELQSHRVG